MDRQGTTVESDLPEDLHPPGKRVPAGPTTRAQDPKLRAAVERRSLDVAKVHYVKELRGSGNLLCDDAHARRATRYVGPHFVRRNAPIGGEPWAR
jgi:hypothetical protein